MGIERVTITAKLEPENALFVQGVCRNWFGPFRITESAVVDGLITIVRLSIAEGRLDPRHLLTQGIDRNCRNGNNESSGTLLPEPKKAPAKAMAKAAGRTA